MLSPDNLQLLRYLLIEDHVGEVVKAQVLLPAKPKSLRFEDQIEPFPLSFRWVASGKILFSSHGLRPPVNVGSANRLWNGGNVEMINLRKKSDGVYSGTLCPIDEYATNNIETGENRQEGSRTIQRVLSTIGDRTFGL